MIMVHTCIHSWDFKPAPVCKSAAVNIKYLVSSNRTWKLKSLTLSLSISSHLMLTAHLPNMSGGCCLKHFLIKLYAFLSCLIPFYYNLMVCFGPDRSYTCHCSSLIVRDGVSHPHTGDRIIILCVCWSVCFEHRISCPYKHSDVLIPDCVCNNSIQFLQSATKTKWWLRLFLGFCCVPHKLHSQCVDNNWLSIYCESNPRNSYKHKSIFHQQLTFIASSPGNTNH